MPGCARREIVADGEVGVYHCVARCVRRAFLCGLDPASGQSFEHRKDWIEDRLRELAGAFGIDVCGFAVLSNHLHLVLRTRPELAAAWSDEEVIRRWRRLFPRRDDDGQPAALQQRELAGLAADAALVATWRRRLASLSWFMRALCEPIARRANREDRCTGRFWEGRFKCQALLDEAAVLACTVYVDLNPIRAGLADTPETSQHTSAYERIAARQAAQLPGRAAESQVGAEPRDAWLCPVPESGAEDTQQSGGRCELQQAARPCVARRGFLPLGLDEYLRLLDWTGRQVRQGKRGAIPADLQPILARLGVRAGCWLGVVTQWGRWFHRAAGRAARLAERAQRAGRRWFHGATASRLAFG